MNHIHGYPHSKKAEFYKLLLDYDESLERDLADCGAIWYESGTRNLMVGDYGMTDRIVSMIISKYFGFIQRLVENNKIDLPKMGDLGKEGSNKAELLQYSIPMKYYKEGYELNIKKEGYLILLCALSIQDNPIEFLISILK